MAVVRYIVIVCCAIASVCGIPDVPEYGGDSSEVYSTEGEDFRTDLEAKKNLRGISDVLENNNDERGLQRILHGGLNITNTSRRDSQSRGSERVARPVVFSYSSTTEPRVQGDDNSQVNTLFQQHPARVRPRSEDGQKQRLPRNRAPLASISPEPMVHYAKIVSRINHNTPKIEEKTTQNEDSEETLTHSVEEEEEDDGGGEEKEEDEENERSISEEESSDNQGEEEENDDYQTSSEDYEENGDANGVVEIKEPKTKMKQFIKDYGPSRNQSTPITKEGLQSAKIEHYVEPLTQVLENPKTHNQKVGVATDKVLQEPLKFYYSEDLSPSESEHKKHHESEYENGGGEEGHSDHHSSQGEKEEKGHKSFHKYDKGKLGHHDKEAKENKFSDQKGKKAKLKDERGHFKVKKHGEKGKKGANYEEKGAHKKGHSTKGEHNIHKKDEYVKKHEFYDEHHEGGEHEKHGGYHEKHGKKHGGKYKTGHKKTGYDEDHHGEKGHNKKGGHHDEHEGHKKKSGHQEHHNHEEKYAEQGGHKGGKKWRFYDKER